MASPSPPPPPRAVGTNCHRSCYTLALKKALPLKTSFYKTCKASPLIQKTLRGE